jgi:hypothetical protein
VICMIRRSPFTVKLVGGDPWFEPQALSKRPGPAISFNPEGLVSTRLLLFC